MSSAQSVVLRLRHPHVDPQEITRRLGIAPQYAWRAGDPRRAESGEEDRGVYRESCWVAELSSDSPLGGLMEMMVARLAPRAVGTQLNVTRAASAELYFVLYKMKRTTPFWQEFVSEGGSIDCLVQVAGTERFHLEMSPALLTLCAELRISLSIEVDGTARRAVSAA